MTVEEGKAAQAAVMDKFEKQRAEWLSEARELAYRLGVGGRVVTTDDIWDGCPPPANCPKVMGAVFKLKDEWTPIGYTPTRRKTSHARVIRQWILTCYLEVD